MNSALRESRAARWLFADRGAEAHFELHHRRIFTLPGAQGLLFLAMLAALLLASINYQLSLGYLLTFLVGALTWVGLHFTFANLAGLRFAAASAAPVFAGEIAAFEFEVSDQRKRARYAVAVHGPLRTIQFNLGAQAHRQASIEVPTTRRGWLKAPRVTIETYFPLGLWRAWSYWQPDLQCLVYPAPEFPTPPLPPPAPGAGESIEPGPGAESFAGLRPYRPGDSSRIVAWKAVARTGGDTLTSKHFEGGSQGELWLDLALTRPALALEAGLSRLSAWVLSAEDTGIDYGLQLPGCRIGPGTGAAHRSRCLEALALFESMGTQ